MTYEQLKEEARKCIAGDRSLNQLRDAISSFVDDCTPTDLVAFAIQITKE